jgi:glycosyltransferase involved in cell wall biosynthesis
MPNSHANYPLKILHILTLNGRNGEYGGPVRVARELCRELNNRGHQTCIFSGALKGSEPAPKPGLVENFVTVKPLLKRFPMSTLWSWRLIAQLTRQIRLSDIVHIHFARDLIPLLAAVISCLNGKPFVAQTHGMVISDRRISTRLIDAFFTRRLINNSGVNLVLTEYELASVQKLKIKSPCKILPNGISVEINHIRSGEASYRVSFCSRLEKRKRANYFVDLANSFRETGIQFEIYGPDGGELGQVLEKIEALNLNKVLEYKGSVPTDQVHAILSETDVLVLPSREEPFPMVVLEALAVGTSVLVMPSCGIANQLKKFESSFVADTEDLAGLVEALTLQASYGFSKKSHSEIANFCLRNFGIASIVDQLLVEYETVMKYAK